MSMIQNLIKKAFGTSNGNEAATFLASACNRMKSMPKDDIQAEVSAALKGVNFSRAGEAPKVKTETKTVYQDTPETLAKIRRMETEAAQLRSNLAAAETQRLRELAELRATLAKSAPGLTEKDVKRAWQEGHNEGWDTGWDAGYKSGCDTTPDNSAEEIAWRDDVIAKLEKACDAYETASKLQDMTDAGYEEEIADLKKKLASSELMRNENFKVASDYRGWYEKAQSTMEKDAFRISHLEGALADAQKKAEDFNRSYNAAVNRGTLYQSQLADAQAKIKELQEESDHNYNWCAALQRQIEEMKKKRGFMGNIIDSLTQ